MPILFKRSQTGLSRRLRVISFAALLAGLGVSAALAESVYRRGETGDSSSFDPAKTSTVPEGNVLGDLFETLVVFDGKAQLKPGAAESWTISDDGLTYTFKLRAGSFSNGDPVKASDFVFTFHRLLDGATAAPYANLYFPIINAEAVNKGEKKPEELGVSAPDDKTLVVKLAQATPYMLTLFAHQTASPVSEANVAKFGKDFAKPGNLASNGAYRLEAFTPNDQTVLVKNDKFRDAAAVKIDKEIFVSIEDRAAALKRFQAGEIDSYDDVPADQIPFIRDKLKDQFKVSPYLGTYYFSFDTRKAPFDDVRVRNALSMVIDREFLAEKIWGGAMLPAYGFVPPGIDNYGPPQEAAFAKLSPIEREDKAKALLKEAGYGEGGKPLAIEIRYNTSENHKNSSLAIADAWKALGVTATFVNADIKAHYALLQGGGAYQVARAGWIGDYSDPQNFLFLTQTDSVKLNYSHYSNPDYDADMKKAGGERDLKKRAAIMADAESLLLRDQPVMPLLYYASKNLLSPKLKGWEANILDRHPARYLSIEP